MYALAIMLLPAYSFLDSSEGSWCRLMMLSRLLLFAGLRSTCASPEGSACHTGERGGVQGDAEGPSVSMHGWVFRQALGQPKSAHPLK